MRPPQVTRCDYGLWLRRRGGERPLTATQFHPEKSGEAGLRYWRTGWERYDRSRGGHREVLPAVDVADGKAVRLVQGEAGTETDYGSPLSAALAWQEQGARWLHLVDLDAAFGRGSNASVIAEVVGAMDIDVELSGGIRDDESLRTALATGCTGSTSGRQPLENPAWCARAIAEHGDRVAVGLDVRGTTLAARGWTKDGGELFTVLSRLNDEGCARFVVTDVTKDGMLAGPNIELLREVCSRDRPAGDRVRRVASLGGCAGVGRSSSTRRRGCDRGQGALQRRVHVAGGAGRGGRGMTLGVRVIPCLDVDEGRVVKGVNFVGLRDAGDPVALAKAYGEQGADELVFLDITASSGDRDTMYDIVSRTAEQVFIPLTVGGGVRTVSDFDRLLRAGRTRLA